LRAAARSKRAAAPFPIVWPEIAVAMDQRIITQRAAGPAECLESGTRGRDGTLQGMFIVGVDVGGTFTDVTAVDAASGEIRIGKVPSQPQDEAAAVLAGLASLGIESGAVRRLVHGTTVGTNAILERRGARVALLTTAGFRDLIEIGRTKRNIPALFVPTFVRPRPVVDRPLRFEVDERMQADGTPLRPLDPAAAVAALERLAAAAPEAVAVCLLHAYANPAHERGLDALVAARLPGVPRSLSFDVVPEYREFERFSTTVLNAYLQPLMDRYLGGLEKRLFESGYAYGVLTVGSSGGMMTVETARRLPIRTIVSGPAGGVSRACFLAPHAGLADFITYDMGGTSTDVCLVQGGVPVTTTEGEIGAFPVKVPQIDIHTVGAGGGSLAWLDVDGSLQVGPRSAGARPGPAAYGLGGLEPTVTDANVVLGRMGTDRMLGGAIRLDAARAHEAVARIARALGLDVPVAADGVVRLAVARMVSSIREISIARGHDPREFTLVAFGGAGPMHAALIAEELAIPRVLIPRHPGNFSALGLLVSDVKHDDARTRVGLLRERGAAIDTAFAEMDAAAQDRLAADGFAEAERRIDRALDLRYVGQAFELTVPLGPGLLDLDAIARDFHARHLAAYGHADPDGEVELVSVRVAARGVVDKPTPGRHVASGDARRGARAAWFGGAAVDVDVFERDGLAPSSTLAGPAIVDEFGATTVVPPDWHACVDDLGNLILERR
jgi:N-methylhydantoinase A